MELKLPDAKVKGLFRTVLKDKEGNIKFDSGFNSNLLLDRFFTKNYFNATYCGVGTGTTPPAVTDTGLAAQLGSLKDFTSQQGSATISGDNTVGYTCISPSYVYRFTLGAIVGNISEFAIFENSSNATAIVRNLIKDSEGNPTTITVTASDQLEIWWKLSKHWPGSSEVSAVTNSFTLNGVTTDVTIKNVNPQLYAGAGKFYFGYPGAAIELNYGLKTLVTTGAVATELLSLAAGASSSLSTQVSSEQSVFGVQYAYSNPVSGQLKMSAAATFALNASGVNTEMQAVVLDAYYGQNIRADLTMCVVSFSPKFIKGTDKVLTISLSYTVSRA